MKETKSLVAEFIGTFGLIFIGGGAVTVHALTNGGVGLVGIGLAHGLLLLAMIYALAGISGAHFNPAVTIAMIVNKRIEFSKGIAYILSQLLGASFAAFALKLIFPVATAEQIFGFPTSIDLITGIMVEALLTFFLVFVVYGVAVSKKATPTVFGLAIGGTIIFDIMMGGNITGAAMNPARAFGPAIASGIMTTQIIYWAGPILGALLGSFVGEWLFKEDKNQ